MWFIICYTHITGRCSFGAGYFWGMVDELLALPCEWVWMRSSLKVTISYYFDMLGWCQELERLTWMRWFQICTETVCLVAGFFSKYVAEFWAGTNHLFHLQYPQWSADEDPREETKAVSQPLSQDRVSTNYVLYSNPQTICMKHYWSGRTVFSTDCSQIGK